MICINNKDFELGTLIAFARSLCVAPGLSAVWTKDVIANCYVNRHGTALLLNRYVVIRLSLARNNLTGQARELAQLKVARLITTPWSCQLAISVDENRRQSRMLKSVEPSSSWLVKR